MLAPSLRERAATEGEGGGGMGRAGTDGFVESCCLLRARRARAGRPPSQSQLPNRKRRHASVLASFCHVDSSPARRALTHSLQR